MASPLDDFPDSDSHWIRLYRKLKERHAGIAASILSGECDDKSYASECGRYGEVAKTIHYAAEGTTEFNVLLFLPARMPMGMKWGE